MSDYIKRSDVLNSIEELKKSPWYNDNYGFGTKQARHDGVNIVVDLCIKEIPAADVKEVVHAEWKRVDDWDNENNAIFDCSNCHHGDVHAKGQEVPYCWYCGAKMDLKHIKEKF